jgi:hypothetical protein
MPPLFLLDEILKMNLFNENSSSTQLASFTNSLELNDTNSDLLSSLNQTESLSGNIDLYGLSVTLLKCLVFLIGEFSFKKPISFLV